MRRAVLLLAGAVLLAGPTILAFFSGGYFTEPRLWAAIVAWVLVLVAALIGRAPLPTSRAGWVAVGALAFLTTWSAISIAWAPLGGPAVESVERLVLYLGVLLAAIGLLRDRRLAHAVEPIVALGTLMVIGYGLSGRLLPGIIYQARSALAGGRLEQPITYWNSEGALAAIGLVLCARLAGDPARPTAVRAAGAAGCAPLGAAIYLSFSRGAIAAAVVGMMVLAALAPTWSQLRAAVLAIIAALTAAVAARAFPGVVSLSGTLTHRERDGAIFLVILLALMAAAALAAVRLGRLRRSGPIAAQRPGLARLLPRLATATVVLAAGGLIAGGLAERGNATQVAKLQTANASRLTSVSSNRYDYWRVGLRAFRDHPLNGVGAGGYRVVWLKQRTIHEGVLQAHSLELEIAAELGLPGLLGVVLLLAGVAVAARRALRRGSGLAIGCSAASVVFVLHATIDWDWELPAVTLPVIIMAGALVAASEGAAAGVPERPRTRGEPRRDESRRPEIAPDHPVEA